MSERLDLAWLAAVLLLLGAALLLVSGPLDTVRAEPQVEKIGVYPVELTVSEPWHSGTFTLTLSSQPGATVSISLTASNNECTVSPAVASLDADSWATGVTATVTAVDDAIADGSQLCWAETSKSRSKDPAFDGLNARDVKVTVLDDDVADIIVRPEILTVSEPTSFANFTVSLTSQPTAIVSVPLTATSSECTVSPTTVLLDDTTWARGAQVTVTAVDDSVADGPQPCLIQTGLTASADDNYTNLNPVDVDVTVLDDDILGGIIVTPTALTIGEPDGWGVFTLTLTSQPTDVVSVPLVSTATEQCTVWPDLVVLGMANWARGVTATVTAVDDAIADGSQTCRIRTGPAASEDPLYRDLNPEDVTVTVWDDEAWGIVVTPTALTIREPDGWGVFTLTLTSQPVATVSVPLSTTGAGCLLAEDSVDLDASNWNSGVTATVTAIADAGFNGPHTCLINTGPTASDDPLYAGLDPMDITVTVLGDIGAMRVYMPLVMRRWPPVPDSPTLAPIDNADGDGTYSISWSSVSGAVLYILEESSNVMFSNAREISADSRTSHLVSQRGAGRHYYRVKARNQWGDSGWSTIRWADVLWEAEPNDQAPTQANGPLISGLTYYGTFPSGADLQDYYYLDLMVPHPVDIWLTSIPEGQNYDLVLRNANLTDIEYSGRLGNDSEHVQTGFLPAGRYYIQVYNRSSGGSSEPYRLSTVYE